MGEKFHWSNLNEQQVKKYRGIEKQLMLKSLDEYLHFCHEFGVTISVMQIYCALQDFSSLAFRLDDFLFAA